MDESIAHEALETTTACDHRERAARAPVMVQPEEVFTPNSPPTFTYVDRAINGKRLEDLLSEGLKTKGLLVSISGASKSGKTVLVERVTGEYRIGVSGAGIKSSDD